MTTPTAAGQTASQETKAVMSLESVTRDYRQGDEIVHALHSTDLHLRAGELVGILGPSGSGKSTLLTIMGGLRTPSSGTVTILGEPFSSLPEKRRARLRLRRIGFVLQASGLVPFLRLNNQFDLHDRVTRTKGDTDRRDHLLDSLGISKRAHAYPSELSGGERQRAAIAVALYHEDVARLLADQTHELGKATVMVTHDERLLPVCDRVLVMHDGVLTEQDAVKDEGHAHSDTH